MVLKAIQATNDAFRAAEQRLAARKKRWATGGTDARTKVRAGFRVSKPASEVDLALHSLRTSHRHELSFVVRHKSPQQNPGENWANSVRQRQSPSARPHAQLHTAARDHLVTAVAARHAAWEEQHHPVPRLYASYEQLAGFARSVSAGVAAAVMLGEEVAGALSDGGCGPEGWGCRVRLCKSLLLLVGNLALGSSLAAGALAPGYETCENQLCELSEWSEKATRGALSWGCIPHV